MGRHIPPPTTAPPVSILRRRITALYHPLPTSSPGVVRRPPGLCPHPPASFNRICSLQCVSASAAVSRVRLPPLAALGLCLGPRRYLGGLPPLVPPSPLFTRLSTSLCEYSYPFIFWRFFLSPRVDFLRVKARGHGASTP